MTTQTPRQAGLALLLLIATLACTPLFAANKPSATPATPTNTAVRVVAATPTPEPLPTFVSPVSPLPGEAVRPTAPTPEVNFEDLSPYHQAMLPNFANDVETVAANGASRYELEITLQPESLNDPKGLVLQGTARVLYTNTETKPLPDIYFYLYPNLPGYGGRMSVQSVIVDDQPVTWQLEAENAALHFQLASPLPPGDSVDITLAYTADVSTIPQQGYNIFSFTNGTAALADFYPAIPVYDDKGWNIEVPPIYGDATYLDVSLYQVKLVVPTNLVVAASGSLVNEEKHQGGTKTLTFVSGPMRDFYLVFRSDFEVVSDTVDGIKVNSYYPPQFKEEGKLALQYATDALHIYSQSFGPYPYAEFDVVATPTTAGGVEYPGIVVIAETIYSQKGIYFPFVVAHEVAHQWWYGMVGNDQVDEPWLDESLTNYSTVLYMEKTEGQDAAKEVIETFFLGPYRRAKEENVDQGVLGPVAHYDHSDYATFIYGKGPLFFDALRREVGDETYLKIMQTYLNTYKYKIAHTEDLFKTIETVSGQNITPLVETWLEGR